MNIEKERLACLNGLSACIREQQYASCSKSKRKEANWVELIRLVLNLISLSTC
jgi:hypothetical protein